MGLGWSSITKKYYLLNECFIVYLYDILKYEEEKEEVTFPFCSVFQVNQVNAEWTLLKMAKKWPTLFFTTHHSKDHNFNFYTWPWIDTI